MTKKNKIYKELRSYLQIVAGTFIMAIGFVLFIAPMKLAPGGVYGVAIILHHLFGFPIGLSGLALDVPLLILGTLILGPRFGVKTVVGIISLSGWISLLEFLYGYDLLIDSPSAYFIMSLFGAVFIGLGLGLIFKTRATSGGTDILASILQKYTHLSIGISLIIVDSIIVLIALAAFKDWEIPLYSWVVIYVTGIVADKVVVGLRTDKTVFIISEKHEEIRNVILHQLGRGGTYIKGEGMYNGKEKEIIYTIVDRKELPTLIHKVHEIDPEAFLSIIDASETLGDGFKSLREKAYQ
ncbi:MAG: YitT family protein [Bacteroidales bacterium]|jgi:uncharacterized membrane-anchored protein YitT (DUF2179 family)|nr:YitT family protein [Bacteroidales bacterium]